MIDPAIVQIVNKKGEFTGDTRAEREAEQNERYTILNKDYTEYLTETKNNIILSMDNEENIESGTNPGLVKDLLPYSANKNYNEAMAQINLEISRYYSSESDGSNIDNIAEIIKAENTVGRRDIRAVAGNANPFALDENGEPIGEYLEAAKEPDVSATEVITLSPPTGLDNNTSRTIQIVLVTLVAVVILAVGIILIKKKVLLKK